jgi:hypothetical protein
MYVWTAYFDLKLTLRISWRNDTYCIWLVRRAPACTRKEKRTSEKRTINCHWLRVYTWAVLSFSPLPRAGMHASKQKSVHKAKASYVHKPTLKVGRLAVVCWCSSPDTPSIARWRTCFISSKCTCHQYMYVNVCVSVCTYVICVYAVPYKPSITRWLLLHLLKRHSSSVCMWKHAYVYLC